MKHKLYDCKCNKFDCMFCEGGLGLCKVCDGFEGTLPTECPGRKMTADEQEKVWKQGLDYVAGLWVQRVIGAPIILLVLWELLWL